MALGMDMLLQSMGVDTEDFKQKFNGAIEYVKTTDARIAVIEQALARVLTLVSQDIPALGTSTESKLDLLAAQTAENSAKNHSEMNTLIYNIEANITNILYHIEDTLEMMRLGTAKNSDEFEALTAQSLESGELQPIEAQNGRRTDTGTGTETDQPNSDAN